MGKKFIAIFFMALLACALTAQLAYASTLDLIGVGWTKSNLTVLIKVPPSVTDAAKNDVVAAIGEWNTANAGVTGAPQMNVVSGVKTADITIRMKVGGGLVLGVTMTKTERFSPVTRSVSIQLSGKAFGTIQLRGHRQRGSS